MKEPNTDVTQQTHHDGLTSKETSVVKICISVPKWNLEARKKGKKKAKPKTTFRCLATFFNQSKSKVDFPHNISICTSSRDPCGTGQKVRYSELIIELNLNKLNIKRVQVFAFLGRKNYICAHNDGKKKLIFYAFGVLAD